jgi:DNA-binding MarR family transcriptional regulator
MAKRRIPESDHRLIIAAYRMGASQVEIAARWGVTQPNISRILKAHRIDRSDRVRRV